MKPGPRDGFRWTRETIIYAFELWHRRHLCSPTVAEWRLAGESHPSVTTVRTGFGSWNSAIAAAGLRPRRPGEARPGGPADTVGRAESAAGRWPGAAGVARRRGRAEGGGRPPTLHGCP